MLILRVTEAFVLSNYTYQETHFLEGAVHKNIHMIGIGGSSMSGLAEFLMHCGFTVSGSDAVQTEITDRLSALGAKVFIGQRAENIENPDLVVYTVAVKEDNPEYAEVVRRNIPMIDRSVLLGELLARYPKSVSISGTHGKTTTTSMIASILSFAGKQPNMHIGGTIKGQKSNMLLGGNEYFINEACEYYNSFLHFKSLIGVVLNIEPDHLDFFGSFENILEAFRNFVSIIPKEGSLVVCKDNEAALSVGSAACCKVFAYSTKDLSADYAAADISFDKNGYGLYTLYRQGSPLGTVHLQIPGLHNISNSLAAIAVCMQLGCTPEEVTEGIQTFTGTSRRFEIKGVYNDITVVDDYAHHPSEIKATIEAAKKGSYRKIWAAFQPHTYTRAKKFYHEFAECFADCHQVVVTDIYAAREKDPGDIHSSQLAEAIHQCSHNAVYKSSLEEVATYLYEHAQPGDVILSLGAGTINQICTKILEKEN